MPTTRLPLECGHARRQGRALRAVQVWFRNLTSEQRVCEHAALARLGGGEGVSSGAERVDSGGWR